jgi:hypothetical protein
MIPVSKEQPLFGFEDDDGRQSLQYPGVVFHPRGIEVCLGIDRHVGEEVNYFQLRHALIVAVNSKIRNPIP